MASEPTGQPADGYESGWKVEADADDHGCDEAEVARHGDPGDAGGIGPRRWATGTIPKPLKAAHETEKTAPPAVSMAS